MRTKITIMETIISLLVFLFLYTALSKYSDLRTFRFSLHMSPIIKPYSNAIALILPAMEIGIVALLVIPKTRLLGTYIATGLLTMFTIYLIGMVSFSKELPCGCGGVVSNLSWKNHIFFNLFFIIISAFAISVQKQIALRKNLNKQDYSTTNL